MRFIKNKNVKIRKSHYCWGCARLFPPKTKMEAITSEDLGKIMTVYWCEDCIDFGNELEEWEKEDGFEYGDFLQYPEYKKYLDDQITDQCDKIE